MLNIGILGASEKVYLYPSYYAITTISIAEIITRVEIVASLLVLAYGFLKIAVLLYGVSLGAAQLCSLRSYRPLVMPVAVLMSILALYNFPNPAEYIRFNNKIYPVYALPFQLVIPLLTLLIAVIKKLDQRDVNSEPKRRGSPTESRKEADIMVLLLIALFTMIILLEIVPLAKEQQWKELIVASVLLIAGFILSMLIMFDIDFPYLAPVISDFVEKWLALPGG